MPHRDETLQILWEQQKENNKEFKAIRDEIIKGDAELYKKLDERFDKLMSIIWWCAISLISMLLGVVGYLVIYGRPWINI